MPAATPPLAAWAASMAALPEGEPIDGPAWAPGGAPAARAPEGLPPCTAASPAGAAEDAVAWRRRLSLRLPRQVRPQTAAAVPWRQLPTGLGSGGAAGISAFVPVTGLSLTGGCRRALLCRRHALAGQPAAWQPVPGRQPGLGACDGRRLDGSQRLQRMYWPESGGQSTGPGVRQSWQPWHCAWRGCHPARSGPSHAAGHARNRCPLLPPAGAPAGCGKSLGRAADHSLARLC